MRWRLLAVAVAAAAYFWLRLGGPTSLPKGDASGDWGPAAAPSSGGPLAGQTSDGGARPTCDNQQISRAFQQHQSRVEVCGSGVVSRVLPDDTEGSRHQRLIVSIGSGHTLLIAHNIDLAPRIDCAQSGARVDFLGEYEWNERGGVVHWTHRDPSNRHPAGWFRCDGRVFQ
ncbi:MAG TPA: DUF3465 domain-containing protein [Steroidobacteraceae bacterium]